MPSPNPLTPRLILPADQGAFVLALAPRVHVVRGVDLTPEMLRRARAYQAEKQISNAAFVLGDAEQLPFPAATFDLVSCQCSFHHMPKPQLVLREMSRVAKPEGRLVIIDPLAPESDAKYEIYNRIEQLRDPSHTLTLRLTEFLRLFDEEGLEICGSRSAAATVVQQLDAARRPRRRNQEVPRNSQASGRSMAGDRAGFSAQAQGEDIQIVHNEGMFLLGRKEGVGGRSKTVGEEIPKAKHGYNRCSMSACPPPTDADWSCRAIRNRNPSRRSCFTTSTLDYRRNLRPARGKDAESLKRVTLLPRLVMRYPGTTL